MPQHEDQKPTQDPKKDAKSHQPTLKELSPEQLGQVSGGLKVQGTDIKLTHKLDAP